MRRLLLLIFAIAISMGGLYILVPQLECMAGLVTEPCYIVGRAFIAGGFMLFLGGYLIWDDFIKERDGS